MEKVIILALDWSSERKAEEVNKYLSQGWIVKSITTESNKDGAYAIFVLEK